jgi:phosphotransferase system HPr (HPr) family protein
MKNEQKIVFFVSGRRFDGARMSRRVPAHGEALRGSRVSGLRRCPRVRILPSLRRGARLRRRVAAPGPETGTPVSLLSGEHPADGGERTLAVRVPHVLHARPSARLVRLAQKFAARLTLVRGEARADAKSILDVLALSATEGDRLEIRAEGPDAGAALDALSRFFAAGFSEGRKRSGERRGGGKPGGVPRRRDSGTERLS